MRGQALLGEDDFVDKLADHLRKHKDVAEIPRSQRYATRPALHDLLLEGIVNDHRKLKRKLSEAVEKHGYRQSEIARIELAKHISAGKVKIMPDILTIGSGGASEGLATVLTQAIALSGMKLDPGGKAVTNKTTDS